MKLSFKFKIALISFAVSGTLLTVFGVAFFTFVYQSGIDRMDRELRALVEVPLRGGHQMRRWEEFDQSLRFIYGESRSQQIALLVLDPEGRILFQSGNAPAPLALLPRPELPIPVLTNRPDSIERDAVPAVHPDLLRRGRGPPGGFGPPGAGPRERPPPPFVSHFQNLQTPSTHWRTGSFRTPEITMVAAMDMEPFQADIRRFRNSFMVAVPGGLLLLAATGWFLASRAMKPVAAIADTAEGITAKGLDRRIPTVGSDRELERLVTVSNHMLDRLEKSYLQAVRFSADAAHELQTPLTILQGELDNAIQTSADGSEEQQRYSMLLEELRNLKAVVQKLLLLAHADEGRLNLNPAPVNLSELIRNAAEDIEIMAPGLEIETRIADGVVVNADAALLNQAIRNMTSNAVKYTRPNGQVLLWLEPGRFTLANTADPIPDEDRPLLFERFHRVEKSRTAAGSGLGLSLAREIARAHNGDLVLNPYANGRVSFTLSLPRASTMNHS